MAFKNLYCEQNAARAKFRSSGEKSANVQSNDFNSTSSTEQTNHTNQSDNNSKQTTNNETLDLADLDLSKLRLTKKDIETLSSFTPSLPKHAQDQLLAQLPPNQARKLSRTLSMQATSRTPCVFKRSSSSGREALDTEPSASASASAQIARSRAPVGDDLQNEDSPLLSFDRNSVLRRSVSRGRDQSFHRRSTSAIRSEFPSRLSYTGDLRSDYNGTKLIDPLTNRYRLTDYTTGIRPEYYSKLPLPTSSNAPQKSPSNETLESPIRRRSSQRGLSRFSRPDLYGSSSSINATDENGLTKVRRNKERETQSVLREIRERSRDRSRNSLGQSETQSREVENSETSTARVERRKSSIPNIRITVDKQNGRVYHTRNKSAERYCDSEDLTDKKEVASDHRGTMTNPRNSSNRSAAPVADERSQQQSASDFTDEILTELLRRSKEYSENGEVRKSEEKKAEGGTLKKSKSKTKEKDIKKVKTKQKSLDVVDKTTNEMANYSKPNTDNAVTVTLPLPKSSKIARRMSYPTKEENDDKTGADKRTVIEGTETNGTVVKIKSTEPKDAKSYPNSKLTPPKEMNLKTKKSNASSSTSSRNAITAVMEKFIEKSTERLSPGKSITSTKSKSETAEASPTKTKKKVKVVKKLIQSDQTSGESKEPTPKSNETSNEASPVKEMKSPEKKLKSGFLYSIGQKFEKMRENSKNKEKEKKLSKSNEMPAATSVEIDVKAPIENESKNDVETVQTIIIPRIVKDSHGESVQKEEITIRQIEPFSINASIPKSEQRKSRIDAVIRNLRERSVPHTIRAESRESELGTESGLLKRAVSVEDMSNGLDSFNKSNVNKVLGLFRRIEKEQQLQKQKSIPSANGESSSKERPKSGGFVSKMKKGRYYTGAKSDTIITLTDQLERQYLSERANQSIAAASNSKIPFLKPSTSSVKPEPLSNGFEFVANGTKESTPNNGIDERSRSVDVKRVNTPDDEGMATVPSASSHETANDAISEKERIRNNRKGLVLELSNEQYNDHFKKISNDCSNNNNSYNFYSNGKSYGSQSNGSSENHMNNNFTGNGNYYPYYGHSHSHSHSHSHGHGHVHSERNSGTLTPSCDMSASYSSDNRSLRDDCESTSTFLSPTDEPELCFDDWSACSGSTDDHSLHPKHLKYASMRNQSEQNHNHNQISSSSVDPAPSTPSDSESVIDRIKRRSYYCRFNEKKPKRTSSIVGPSAQREYYREMANKTKPRSSDYLLSSNGFQAESEGSFSRSGSKSPTPMNVPSSNHFKENSSRANTPGSFSMVDENEKYKTQPQYHYHFRQRSQTPSRSVKSPFNDSQAKSSEYLNLRSTLTSPPASVSKYYSNPSPSSLPTSDHQHNGNRSYGLRNSAYDSLSPSIYGTYNPKRRLSTSYLAPAIAAANSSSPYSSTSKDQLSTSCYATLGRTKPKTYDHRSLSMLDTGSLSPSSLLSKRLGASNSTTDHPYTHSHYRPHDYGHFNSRSSLRSPTIIHSSTSNV